MPPIPLFTFSLLLACSPAQATVKNPDTFVYGIIGDVDSLDPHWQYDGISQHVVLQVYETLLLYKGPSLREFEPLLSEKVPSKANGLVSADGRTYTFPIRRGARFHDGSPLTPEDVRYSVLRFLLMDRDGGGAALLLEPMLGLTSTRGADGKPRPGLLEEAECAVRVEGRSLVLRLKHPFAPFLSTLAANAQIVPKAWLAAHGGWDGTAATWARHNNPAKEDSYLHDHANGTGPFRLERWDKNEKQVVLVRNDGYWRAPARLVRVVFRTVDEFGARKLLLQAGDADAVFAERQFLPQLEGLPGVVVEGGLPLMEVHNAFIFNRDINVAGNPFAGSGKLDGDGVPPDFFADEDAREGFARAFDYDAYLHDGYRGRGVRARGPIPRGVFGYNPEQPVRAFDPAKATEHLKRAHGGRLWEKGFRMSLIYMQGRADRELACTILKRGLEALNPRFRLDVRGVQWSTYLSAFVQRRFPMNNARWALDYPDAHASVFPYMHSGGHYARTMGYRSARADKLVEAAAAEQDEAKRADLYRELQVLANEDLPAIFTIDTFMIRARRAWVRGWDFNPILMYGYLYPVRKEE